MKCSLGISNFLEEISSLSHSVVFLGGSWEELPHAPTPEARVSSREEQPQAQGALGVPAQEGLEALHHVVSQEGWW